MHFNTVATTSFTSKYHSSGTSKSGEPPPPAAATTSTRASETGSSWDTANKTNFMPFHSSTDGDASRLAVEKLINDDEIEEEWFNMSLVKNMFAKNDEINAADDLVTHEIKSPRRSNRINVGDATTIQSNFPAGFDASNVSGLSILNEASQQAHGTLEEHNDKATKKSSLDRGVSMSIMAQVLANTKEKDSERTKLLSLDSGIAPPPSPGDAPAALSTPIKCIRSLGSVFAAAEDSLMSPTAMLHAGEGLNTNLSIPPYSPAATSSNILRAFDEDAMSTSLLGTNSLMMIAADDYEAVSALGALSNSPFKSTGTASLSQSPAQTEDNMPSSQNRCRTSNDTSRVIPSAARQSLFSKVIGGSKRRSHQETSSAGVGARKDLSPKKKLKF
jgi:hypothetical protein